MKREQTSLNNFSSALAVNCAGAVLALAFSLNVRADSGDIQSYYVAKEHKFAQTSAAPSIEALNPWQFTAEILASSGTSSGSSSVQFPTLTLPNTTNMSFVYNTGRNTWRVRQSFPDRPSFENSFPNGSYTFVMPTITPPATTFNPTLGAMGDVYPNSVPSLTNTSWSGGNLVIDPTQDFTFTWNSFTGGLPGALIVVSIDGFPDQQLTPTATSLTLPANSLPPGQLIGSAKLNFINPTTTDTTSVPGVTGLGGYINSVIFDIQTLGGPAQDVQDYLVEKTETLVQTSTAPPAVVSFGFSAAVHTGTGGTLISASVTLPAGSTNPSPQALGPDGNGGLDFNDGSVTQAGLDAQFNNGTYGLNITGGSGSYSANLTLTGNAYPASTPTITNTNWSGGALVIDPTQNFTFTWNSFSDFSPGDAVALFDENGAFNFYFDTNTTSQFIAAGTLAPNTTYTFRLTFNHLVDTNTSSIPGASGSAGYQHNTGFTIQTVSGPPTIISPLVASSTVGVPFTYQFEADGATSLGVSNLPPGLAFNAGLAAITGTPTTAGTFNVGLSASNTVGTTNATLAITVLPPPASGPTIITSTAATARTGQLFSFRAITTGGSPAARVSASGLPAGLSINAVTGVISGTPTSDGSFAVSLTVTDGPATTGAIVQLTFISDPAVPAITSPGSALLTLGQFFTYTIVAPSTAGPGTFDLIGALPQGLNFNAGTGTISGIPTGLSRKTGKDVLPKPDLAGGVVLGSVQLFATTPSGTATFPLLFLRPEPGVVNISTRLLVGTGENALIGGFIITGNAPKVVIVRAIGPSTGVPGALQDPTLELHDSAGHVTSNDDWRSTQEQIILGTTIPPADNRESAIVAGLDPGAYTAIVAGKEGATGVALVEAYDLGTASLDTSGSAKLANISTRGFVDTGNSVMIGGFIIRSQPNRVIVRGIGPSLGASGIQGALQDTTLELRDSNGSLIRANDDWRSDQEQEIIDTTIPPADNRESAIVATLNPGAYTGIVAGKNGTTGVGLVEVYALQ
jgi:hypothetical protein